MGNFRGGGLLGELSNNDGSEGTRGATITIAKIATNCNDLIPPTMNRCVHAHQQLLDESYAAKIPHLDKNVLSFLLAYLEDHVKMSQVEVISRSR